MKVGEILQETKKLYEAMERDLENKQIYRNKIIEMNIKLVPHILKKYKPYTEDMYQEGCIGLIKAADSYDSSKQVPFVNYACLCIEREIQLAHGYSSRRFEYRAGASLKSLDEDASYDNGDEVSVYDRIEDASAQGAFDELLIELDLDTLYDTCILPCLEEHVVKGRGKSTIDVDQWKIYELQYITELSMEDSQRSRLTFTRIADMLGTTTQNIRLRHKRLMDSIKEQCALQGYTL